MQSSLLYAYDRQKGEFARLRWGHRLGPAHVGVVGGQDDIQVDLLALYFDFRQEKGEKIRGLNHRLFCHCQHGRGKTIFCGEEQERAGFAGGEIGKA